MMISTFKKAKLDKNIDQVLFIFLSMSVQFSITTVDFIFFEKISYKAAIGVGSIMAIIYLAQNIITYFSQSMINNAIYHYPDLKKDFSKTVSASFLISLVSYIIVVAFIIIYKDPFLSKINIDEEAKNYALKYIIYGIPFLVIFGVEQFFMYLLYALKKSRINFIYICIILILNVIYNYIAVYKLKLGTEGIALSSFFSILTVLPLYLIVCYRNNIKIYLFTSYKYYKTAIVGIKNLGAASFLSPIFHHFMQALIVILISQIAQEMISARSHARNFLTFAMALSLSFGVLMQINTSKLFGEGSMDKLKLFYKKYMKIAILFCMIFTSIIVVFISLTVENYSSNSKVQHYIILCLVISLFIEPMRMLSIGSRTHLLGLQSANLPVLCSILNKLLFAVPAYYLVVSIFNLGLIGILLVSGLLYLVNFIVYSLIINKKYKDNHDKKLHTNH